MPANTKATAAAFSAIVAAAESEGRPLTDAERLQNPSLQKDMETEKAQAIASAERALEVAHEHLKNAELALKVAKQENK